MGERVGLSGALDKLGISTSSVRVDGALVSDRVGGLTGDSSVGMDGVLVDDKSRGGGGGG